MNTSFRMAPWADVLYACDAPWWQHYAAEVASVFRGERWTVSDVARDRHDVNWIHGLNHAGLSKAKEHIHLGFNSGYQAIGLAHLFGAARILLLGFDFQRSSGKTHWFGEHPAPLRNDGIFKDWIWAMNKLASDAQARGLEIVNCTRTTALRCFVQTPLEQAL